MSKKITAEEFDRIFDEGKEDILQYMDLSSARRPNLELQRFDLDCPNWMITALDREAGRIGITRQSLIKMWLADRLSSLVK